MNGPLRRLWRYLMPWRNGTVPRADPAALEALRQSERRADATHDRWPDVDRAADRLGAMIEASLRGQWPPRRVWRDGGSW